MIVRVLCSGPTAAATVARRCGGAAIAAAAPACCAAAGTVARAALPDHLLPDCLFLLLVSSQLGVTGKADQRVEGDKAGVDSLPEDGQGGVGERCTEAEQNCREARVEGRLGTTGVTAGQGCSENADGSGKSRMLNANDCCQLSAVCVLAECALHGYELCV